MPAHFSRHDYRIQRSALTASTDLAEELLDDALPHRPVLGACPPCVELLGGLEALSASDEIDLGRTLGSLSLPEETDDVEEDEDGECQVGKEERLSRISWALSAANREDGLGRGGNDASAQELRIQRVPAG